MSFLCPWNKTQKLKIEHALGQTVVNLERGHGGKLDKQNHCKVRITTRWSHHSGKDTSRLHSMASQLETNRPWKVFLIFIPTTNCTIKTIRKVKKKKKHRLWSQAIRGSTPYLTTSYMIFGRPREDMSYQNCKTGVITNTSSAQLFWGLNEMVYTEL